MRDTHFLRRPRPGIRLLASLCALAPSACYDWQIGAGDAASDGPHDSARPDTGNGTVDTGAPIKSDATHDAQTPLRSDARVDAGSCPSLLAAVDAGCAAAKACSMTLPSDECTTFVADPCGCQVSVAEPSGPSTSAYVSAVHALVGSGCSLGCAQGCLSPPVSGVCLEGPKGAGFAYECSP